MKIFSKEVKIGLASIVCIAMFVFGVNYLKGKNIFKPSSYFYVHYTDIKGLAKSSPVYADGYKVGIVRDIHYNYHNPGNVVVEVGLDTEMRIAKGSVAELEIEMLGSVKMNLLLATNMHDAYHPGDTLPGVVKNGIMDAVNKTLMPEIQKIMPRIDSVLISLNTLLANPDIPKTLASVRQSTQDLSIVMTNLKGIMNKDLPLIAQNLTTITKDFSIVSGNLKNINYASTFEMIDSTLTNLRTMSSKLNQPDNTLGLLLNDRVLYDQLTNTGTHAANLMQDLKENPKRYVHFSLFGRKAK